MTSKKPTQASNEAESSSTEQAPAESPLSPSALKNFRHHPDIENFYRFVYENDLRYEALELLSEYLKDQQARKKLRKEKASN